MIPLSPQSSNLSPRLVTALEPQRRRGGKRVNVFVDGEFAFSVDAEVARAMRVGQQLAGDATAGVLERDQFQRALDTALTFLGHRPRSEREVRRRLARAETPPTIVEEVMEKLRRWDLVDDQAFAAYWIEQRQTFRPRGTRLLRAELRQRGVSGEVAASATHEAETSADDDAYRAAAKKAQQLAALDERTFRTRLSQFLGRRGFGWDTITPTVERLWRDTGHGS